MHGIPIVIHDRLYIPTVPDNDFMSAIISKFTHTNPDYFKLKHIGKYVNDADKYIKTWDHVDNMPHLGNVSGIAIPRGGTNRIRHICDEYHYEPIWLDHRLTVPCNQLQEFYEFDGITLWPEQEKLVAAMLKHENCLVRSPTASGKTESALKLVEYLLQKVGPVLIIVWEGTPNSGLFKQWIDRISARFNIKTSDIGMVGDGRFRLADITVAMQQTLRNRVNDVRNHFGAVICDEVQRFAATTFRVVLNRIPAYYRIGISADETRADDKEFLTYDMFGEVVEEIDKEALLARNKICPVIVRVVPTNFNFGVDIGDRTIWWNDMPSEMKTSYIHKILENMFNDEEREGLIANFIIPCLVAGNTTLVTSLRIDHVKKWQSYLISKGFHCGLMIGGKKNADVFERSAEALRKKEIQVGVGTYQKMSTAHDIPSLERGFVLGPTAGNKQKFNQMMGRLGRTYPGKEIAYLYYFWDRKCYPGHLRNLKRAGYTIEIFNHTRGVFE